MTTPVAIAHDEHFKLVADAISCGKLVIFLGAGANLCDRSDDKRWDSSSGDHLPSGDELARHLADKLPVHDPEYCQIPQCPMTLPAENVSLSWIIENQQG